MKEEPITAYKGFDSNLKCRGFQYEVGKTYEHDGKIEPCKSGFHACPNPLGVFDYYPPATSRYCEVEQSGEMKHIDDKVCSSRLTINAEIGLTGLINTGVKFILDKVNWKDNKKSNTGNCSAATNTGSYSAAIVGGKDSIAIVTGRNSFAKGSLGCWLVLTERDEDYRILGVKAVKVDGEAILPDKFYWLKNGEVQEYTEPDNL